MLSNAKVRPAMHIKNTIKFLCFSLLLLATQVSASQQGSLTEAMTNPGYEEQPAWFKTSFLDIDEDLQEAHDAGKRLLLFFYQDGCPYCKKLLQDNFSNKNIAEKTQKNFDVVSINIWGDREITLGGELFSEKIFAEKLNIMYTPTLLFFNEKGKIVLRTNGYYHPEKFNVALDYVLNHIDEKQSFNSYLKDRSPESAAGVLHQEVTTLTAPFDFKNIDNKKDYSLIMFEQKQCRGCDELHNDILLRKESKRLINNFDVAVIDMWSNEEIVTHKGKKIKISDWAKELSVQYAPTQIYFDRQGEEVFRIEAYLRSFHVQSVMDYVSSHAYKDQKNFQRYIDARADRLREQGQQVDIMN